MGLKKGDLVRVLPEKCRFPKDQKMLDEHGALWISLEDRGGRQTLLDFRSLATGEVFMWWEDQYEEG